MAGSAISTPTFQAVNANIANDGSADSPRGWAISTNADYTFTATGTSRARVTATSANRSVTLPTTNIKAGTNIEVATACSGGYTIAIKSSDTTTIDTMIGSKGSIRLVALQDTPTASSHWEVVRVYDEGTYTPTWYGSGGNPSIGNGTIVGTFARIGSEVTASIVVTAGSTTTFGSGAYHFTLPYTVASQGLASCAAEDTGVANYLGYAAIGPWNANTVAPFKYDNNYWSSTVPFTFGSGDKIKIGATYIKS